MTTPNWQHHSNKPPKYKKKPRMVQAAKKRTKNGSRIAFKIGRHLWSDLLRFGPILGTNMGWKVEKKLSQKASRQ